VLARRPALDEIGVGQQAMAHGNLFDDIGVVAGATEPLIDDVDEADVIGAVETGVHQVGPVDVEDHVADGLRLSVSLFHDRHCDKGVLHTP